MIDLASPVNDGALQPDAGRGGVLGVAAAAKTSKDPEQPDALGMHRTGAI
jgi:hypothetical protein